jgi:hypothetical protein
MNDGLRVQDVPDGQTLKGCYIYGGNNTDSIFTSLEPHK